MLLKGTCATGTRAPLFRAALLACTATVIILLLLTSERSEAQALTGRAISSEQPAVISRMDKASPPNIVGRAGQSAASPAMSKILPFVVITDSFNFVPGQTYPLIYSDTAHGSSNFLVTTFNGNATASTLRAWIVCGYNPRALMSQWPDWCPEYADAQGSAPTIYWLGSGSPLKGPYYAQDLLAGEGFNGWWLDVQDMGPAQSCPWLAFLISRGGQDYVMPMADMETFEGSVPYLHLRALYTFHIQNSYAVCSPPPDEPKTWYIEGVFLPR